jgi:hypothetical protein
MSSVLHPVGPEPAPTYWARRVAVLGAAILVLAIVVALIVNGTSSGSPQSAAPAPAVTSPSASTAPAETASPIATPTATAAAERNPRATPSSTPKPTAKATPTRKPGPVACPADELRPTLTGKQRLKVKRGNTFRLSLINGSGVTCIAEVNSKNFELKIYSGTDRIWSTRDCTTAVRTVKKKLAGEQALEWTLAWNGRRSRDNCKSRPEIPLPGTYFATAQLDGAKPVQLRMILVG